MKFIYEPPVVETNSLIIEGIIATSRSAGITVSLEEMEPVTLGDDGYGNNDILLNF